VPHENARLPLPDGCVQPVVGKVGIRLAMQPPDEYARKDIDKEYNEADGSIYLSRGSV
jgi:hypothetical protein